MAPVFRLAHLSDPHLPPPEGAAGGTALKQRLAQAAWRRKRTAHRPEVLAALISDVEAWRPDHVAITGDLVNFAAAAEFDAARRWLETLAAPRDLTIAPGNHDALVPAAPERWAAWAPWMEDAPGAFPKLRVRAGVALVSVCSAVPTPLFSALGRIGAAQLARLEAMLMQAGTDGLHRVVLIHHTPIPGAAPHRKALADAPKLAEVLRRFGAELVLHGHLHRASLGALEGPDGPIPVLGAPSASSGRGGTAAARWHALEIATTPGGGAQIRVSARERLADGAMGPLGGYVLPARGG